VLDLLPGPVRSGGLLVLARTWRRRDRLAADVAVARSGMRSGWVLIAAGAASVFAVGPIGLWLGLLGWLLLVTSRVAASRATFRQAAAAVPVAEAMSIGVPEVAGWRSVAVVLDEVVLPARRQVFPVRGFDGSVNSVVLLSDLASVPADDRDLRRAQDLARPAARLRPEDRMDMLIPEGSGFDGIAQGPAFAVVQGVDGTVLGVVGPEEMARTLAVAALSGKGAVVPYPQGIDLRKGEDLKQ
jgi:hypothetical protein